MDKAIHTLEWLRLLAEVLPIFTSQLPNKELQRLKTFECDTLENIITVFEFEMWLLPDTIQEWLASTRVSHDTHAVGSALTFLLDSFEGYVNASIVDMDVRYKATANECKVRTG
jgi:hypothetical protein